MDKKIDELVGAETPNSTTEKSIDEKIVIMKAVIEKLERVEQLLNAVRSDKNNG